jgi:hypothetical protein
MAEHLCGLHRSLGDQEVDLEWQQLEDDILIYVGLSAYEFQNLAQDFQLR